MNSPKSQFLNANELSLILCKIDPMGTGCSADVEMQDEYSSQAQEIIELLTQGEDHRVAVIRVFDAWFWEDCLTSDSRLESLEKILHALGNRP